MTEKGPGMACRSLSYLVYCRFQRMTKKTVPTSSRVIFSRSIWMLLSTVSTKAGAVNPGFSLCSPRRRSAKTAFPFVPFSSIPSSQTNGVHYFNQENPMLARSDSRWRCARRWRMRAELQPRTPIWKARRGGKRSGNRTPDPAPEELLAERRRHCV